MHISSTQKLVEVTILGVIVIYVVKNLYFTFNCWLRLKYSYKIMRECSMRMMNAYVSKGYKFFLDNNVVY